MPSTYTLIKGETLASSAASYTFTAIPSTFTDLVVRVSIRDAGARPDGDLSIKLNSDTTNNSYTWIRGTGSSAGSSYGTGSMTGMYGGITNGNTSTANTFSSHECYIPNYNSTTSKATSTFSAQEDNQTAAYILGIAGLNRATAAVTSITILCNANLLSGSSFYLYGISKS
jgi:hypothetical protein